MDPQKTFLTPRAELENFGVRLGKIFSNMAIVMVIVTLFGIMSFVTTVLVMLIGICVTIITLGTIFIIAPEFWDKILSTGDFTGKIASFFMQNIFLFMGLAVGLSVISIVFLSFDKHTKHVGRIVVSSIVIAVAAVSLIVFGAGVIS